MSKNRQNELKRKIFLHEAKNTAGQVLTYNSENFLLLNKKLDL